MNRKKHKYIGYIKVSRDDATIESQKNELRKVGCKIIFKDIIDTVQAERKGLTEVLKYVERGDSLVVWKLDRLGRSIQHLIETILFLNDNGIEFISIKEEINTGTESGKIFVTYLKKLLTFEKNSIRENTILGLQEAKKQGRVGGRPTALTTKDIQQLQSEYQTKKKSIKQICKQFNISRATLYKYVNKGANTEVLQT